MADTHSCAEVRAAIELSFTMVSGVTPDTHVLDGGPHATTPLPRFSIAWRLVQSISSWTESCLPSERSANSNGMHTELAKHKKETVNSI